MQQTEEISTEKSVISIGTYDGVHLGHRRLVAEGQQAARERGCSFVVVTFDRHPASVVRPQVAPLLLTTLDQKLELLRSLGVGEIVVLHFDLARASESAEDFIASVLVGQLHADLVIVGANFRFGHGQRGDVALLNRLGAQYGYDTKGLELVTDDAGRAVVSSTRIRGLVRDGQLAEAAALLGRPHEVRGVLTELSGGDAGRLGVVVPSGICVPPPGRYRAIVAALGEPGRESDVRVLEEEPGAPFGSEIVLGEDGHAGPEPYDSVPSGGAFFVQFMSSREDDRAR